MLILKIKQAEYALADGRLDEACEIASAAGIREHRRGQKLIGKVARALVRRGRDNLENHRIQQALDDCNKASKLAGNLAEVAELKLDVCKAVEAGQARHANQSHKLAQARKRIENGWLSAGECILGEIPSANGQAKQLRQHADAARIHMADVAAKVRKALDAGDFEASLEILHRANLNPNCNGQIGELKSRLKNLAVEKIRSCFEAGRIDQALATFRIAEPVTGKTGPMQELESALGNCISAARMAADGKPRQAVIALKKVAVMYPSAKWLNTAADSLQRAANLLEEVATGPLGLIEPAREQFAADDDENPLPGMPYNHSEPVPEQNEFRPIMPEKPTDSPKSRFVLQIDGVGSFLVVRDATTTVGPVSSSSRPLVPLIADPNLPTAALERSDDDYFLRCQAAISVNGAQTTQKLLADGDKIALSHRCTMKFSIPNPASTTAVLDLTGARLPHADIRKVLLMDREILIGPELSSHIRTADLDKAVALYFRDNRMYCPNAMTAADGKPLGPGDALPIGKPVQVAGLSLVLTEFES